MSHAQRLSQIHVDCNQVTRGDWKSFAPHRARVTELISRHAPKPAGSLCVLGAGNGNDLDLASLAQQFDTITLADLDRDALQHCLQSQPASVAGRIEIVAGVDLSGMLQHLDQESARIDEWIESAVCVVVDGLSRYDVVASTCLLTQMIDSVVSAIGPDHPRFAELVLALRDGHLRLLGQRTRAGGTAILVSDFVSSDTLPALKQVPDDQLEGLLVRAIAERNFFTGVHPGILVQRFGAVCGGTCTMHEPWRWRMGNRAYAVCAVSMTKSA